MEAPIPAQQKRTEESRKEFQDRMFDMVAELKTTERIFFYKVISRSMATELMQGPFAYALEFPRNFLMEHSKKFGKDVTFGLNGSNRTWSIKLTVRTLGKPKARVFAYGDGGWKKFLMENHIEVGDILIFTLIRCNEFEVLINRAPVEVQSDDDDGNMDNDVKVKWSSNTSPWWNADQAPEAPESSTVCKQAPPCPRFVVTIRTRTRHSSLAVPRRFWKLHRNMLESDELQLKGPNKAICMVKAKRTYDEEKKSSALFWIPDGMLSVLPTSFELETFSNSSSLDTLASPSTSWSGSMNISLATALYFGC